MYKIKKRIFSNVHSIRRAAAAALHWNEVSNTLIAKQAITEKKSEQKIIMQKWPR